MRLRDLLKHCLAQSPLEDVEQALLHAVGGHLGASCADVARAIPDLSRHIEDALVAVAHAMVERAGHLQDAIPTGGFVVRSRKTGKTYLHIDGALHCWVMVDEDPTVFATAQDAGDTARRFGVLMPEDAEVVRCE